MRTVIQRVKRGSVKIGDGYLRTINKGMVILIGIHSNDSETNVNKMVDKIINLRIFNDDNEKLNLNIKQIDGEILAISQFTLYGDTKRGNRPSFTESAHAEKGEKLYNYFLDCLKNSYDESKIKYGIFGEMMEVEIINDGPVTIIMDF